MIDDFIRKIGFTDKEIKIYLCVLEHGKLSATDISRIAKVNRTTVYSVCKELISKRVITEDLGSGVNRYYSALPIEDLRLLYISEEKELQAKKSNIEDLIKELALVPKSQNYSIPKIRFVDEANIGNFLNKQLLTWVESAKSTDKNWWGFQDATLLEEYPDWVKYHWEVLPKDFGMKVFTNKKPAEKKMASKDLADRRAVKYWDKSTEFTATHVVLGNYVLFIMTHQHPHYLVEINDTVMAENLRQMFKGIWEKI